MGLKLQGAAMSTATALVITCLHEKEVEFEFVPVDLFTGQHKHPDFLAKNPFGLVPALEDDDLTLFESRAITAYICDKFKETGYDLTRHKDPKEAAIVKVWAEVESQHYNPAITPIIYQHFVAPMKGESLDQSALKTNLDKLTKVLDVYETRLSSCKYLAGDFYSIADLHHVPYTYYVMKTEAASLVNERPHVRAWWDDISSRPAFLKAAEGMTFGES